MSYRLDTPCATTSTTQKVNVYEYTWDLFTSTSVNSTNSAKTDTYTATSYASSTSSSNSSSLPITYQSQIYKTSDGLSPNTISRTGCFVEVGPSEFTTLGSDDAFTSYADIGSTSVKTESSSTLFSEGTTFSATGSYHRDGFSGPVIYDEPVFSSTSSSSSSSWSGSSLFITYNHGDPLVPAVGNYTASCESIYPSTPIVALDTFYGIYISPQYELSSIHPNILAPVSYLSFSSVTQTSETDYIASSSTTYPDGYISQSNSSVFVLKSSTTSESNGQPITIYSTTSETYSLNYTIESSSEFVYRTDTYFSQDINGIPFPVAGGQAYSFTFDVGFYAWTINDSSSKTTGSCSYKSSYTWQTTIETTDSSNSRDYFYSISVISESYQYYGGAWATGYTSSFVYRSYSDIASTYTTTINSYLIADGSTDYDTTSASWSFSGIQFSDPYTSSSSSSVSGNVPWLFDSLKTEEGTSSTEISVPDGAVLVFEPLKYYWNTQSSAVTFIY